MSFLSKLFSSGTKSAKPEGPKPTEYKGMRITPDPIKDGANFRIAATIEMTRGDETLSHHLIRADTLGSHDQACEASINKAKLMIDQMGERLFG